VAPVLAPAVATARGARETNQDRACALRTLVAGRAAVLLAVAGGIGDPAAAESAADLAVQVVSRFARYVIPDTEPGPSLRDALGEMLRAGGRRIRLWARERGHEGRAGSTLACALVWDHRYLVAHTGGGRCYRIDGRGVTTLAGDPAQARPTSVLGSPTEAVVETTPPGDDPGTLDGDGVVLVCCDGLNSVLEGQDMHAAVLESRCLEDGCRRLVALALDRGWADNVSIAAVEIGSVPRRSHAV
jgi:protein phosphatase